MISLSRLCKYLTQDIQWSQMNGSDNYGKPTYSTAVTIKGRKLGKQKLVKDLEGREIVSDTTVIVVEGVSTGDLIDGREVLAVEDVVTYAGLTPYREVML